MAPNEAPGSAGGPSEAILRPFHGETKVVPVRLSLGEIHTIREGDTLWVVFRPAVESLDLSFSAQLKKLKTRSWACVAQRATQLPGDSQSRNRDVVDRKTFTMWLATVNENNVPEEKRPLLIALQQEAADALDAYFHEGGAINPRATDDQLTTLIARAQGQAAVLQTLQGVVHPEWLEAHGRIVAARALGIEPDLDPATRPLTVDEYLEERGVAAAARARIRSGFGVRLAAAYRVCCGREPMKVDRNIGGRITPVNGYIEGDRALFDQVWQEIGGTA